MQELRYVKATKPQKLIIFLAFLKKQERSDFAPWSLVYNHYSCSPMPSLLCRLQILVGWELEQSIPTVVHTVQELPLWTKGIEWSHLSAMSSYSEALSTLIWNSGAYSADKSHWVVCGFSLYARSSSFCHFWLKLFLRQLLSQVLLSPTQPSELTFTVSFTISRLNV